MIHLFYKKWAPWAGWLLVGLALSCKKTDPDNATPQPTTACQIQKITYDTGEYELYTFDANGFLLSEADYFKDANGKIPTSVTPSKLSYNSQGLLDRVTYTDGSGGYEQYSYTNGALSKVEVFTGGKVIYQVDVTTNANKQITALKSTNIAKDPDAGGDYTTKFTLDAQGNYTRLEATSADGVFFTADYSGYDATIQSPWKALKGVPFYQVPYNQYGTTYPITATIFSREIDQYAYDSNGNYVGLKKVYDNTATRTTNSNGYVAIRKDVEAVGQTTQSTTYQYSNCK